MSAPSQSYPRENNRMLRRLVVASVVFTAACAGQQKPAEDAAANGNGGKPVSTEERVRIGNQPAFDVASCFPRELDLPPSNQGVLVGAMLTTRPEVLECLVSPSNRGPAEKTVVTVKTTVTDTSATHAISGDNLTPTGQQCVQGVVDKLVKPKLLAKGAAAVESTATFEHDTGSSASVKFGVNDGSDFSGAVRLAQQEWCDCYAGYKGATPPVLTSHVTLVKGQPTAEVTFDASGSTEGDQLAACLKTKVLAVPAKVSTDKLTYPHRFVHFNSNATEATSSLPPQLRFFQLEVVRNQRAADAAIAFGARAAAAEAFEAVVAKYQKTKDYKLFDELSGKCNNLVEAAQGWVKALEAQQVVDQASVALVQELKTTDAEGWTPVETASQTALTNTQKDLSTAQARVEADQKACPKKSYKK
ncbi:hypothetical protein SAMN05443572_106401 [Myxococcus fulvus]|uniref:Uncharacterized protein n=2 Tax=Myxococcus fulvus TaxID=33 RepID=A0A511T205_MYXFU|nr:hypothetical protein MFU01_32110 [Myxococcus fulvus]SEU22395.1 hypothetical protein SAMN05443572_106401 [Myxococcus fulvus]